eukprot:9404467-Pyramimonas_sp.AAC.1
MFCRNIFRRGLTTGTLLCNILRNMLCRYIFRCGLKTGTVAAGLGCPAAREAALPHEVRPRKCEGSVREV